jgi:hypothetical protein
MEKFPSPLLPPGDIPLLSLSAAPGSALAQLDRYRSIRGITRSPGYCSPAAQTDLTGALNPTPSMLVLNISHKASTSTTTWRICFGSRPLPNSSGAHDEATCGKGGKGQQEEPRAVPAGRAGARQQLDLRGPMEGALPLGA